MTNLVACTLQQTKTAKQIHVQTTISALVGKISPGVILVINNQCQTHSTWIILGRGIISNSGTIRVTQIQEERLCL